MGHRLPLAQRRQDLLVAALAVARAEGVGAVTLARVAQAGGVSKPLVYQHFGTRTGLLRAMYDVVSAQHERIALDALRDAELGIHDTDSLIRTLCATYLDCSERNGALYDEIGAALVALGEPGDAARLDAADRYAVLVARAAGRDSVAEVRPATTALLGAGDRLCEAVLAGRLGRATALETLVTVTAALLGRLDTTQHQPTNR